MLATPFKTISNKVFSRFFVFGIANSVGVYRFVVGVFSTTPEPTAHRRAYFVDKASLNVMVNTGTLEKNVPIP